MSDPILAPPDPCGCGPSTRHKLDRLAKILPWTIKMASRFVRATGGTYWYIDANAGPGQYPDGQGAHLLGSPIIALRFLRDAGVPYRAVLIDRDAETCVRLEQTLLQCGLRDGRVEVYCQENATALPAIAQRPHPARDRGLLFVDPKGMPDFALLDQVLAGTAMRHVDVLVNVPTRTLKLERGFVQRHATALVGKWQTKDVRPLTERLALLHKCRVLVGEPVPGPLRWSLLLGTNWAQFPEWKAGQFDATDGAIGRERLARIGSLHGERSGGIVA